MSLTQNYKTKEEQIRQLKFENAQLKQTIKELQYQNNLKMFDKFIATKKKKIQDEQIDYLMKQNKESQNKISKIKRIYLEFYNTIKEI